LPTAVRTAETITASCMKSLCGFAAWCVERPDVLTGSAA
jgi:hypothetical protein